MNIRKYGAVILSAAVLMSSAGICLPAVTQAPETLTAYAAEADYPWSTYLKNSASWFSSSEAITVADACITYQVAGEGGWEKGMGTAHTGDWAHSTIDNDATTSQIRFLMRTYAATGQQKYFDCAMRGVDCLFKMQYDNGGFMQCYNTPGTYHAHITLNDAAYLHVMEIMKEMSTKSGDFTQVSDSYAQKAAASLEKAVQCLLNMQITVNGVKTAWCQQHDEKTLAPTSARAYELPSICTSESAGIVNFLYKMAQETGRNDIIRSVNAAITWFKKVTLYGIKFVAQGDDKVVVQDASADPLWARFYDLEKEIPLFSDRDSSVHYDVSEISQERRTGYAWYGNWGKNVINLALLPETQEVEPEYQGNLISSLLVHDTKNGGNWSIQQNLNVGSRIYGDRDFTVSALPQALSGAEYVCSACDSKTFTGDLAELTAAADLTVYVLADKRLADTQGITPAWLSGWTELGETAASSNGESFRIYTRELSAGQSLTLGSNMTGTGVMNYFAAVKRYEPPVETTTATATTTTTTTTVTEPKTEKMTGDVDCSGSVSIADAVLLAQYLAEIEGTTISAQGLENAETDGAAGLNSDDNTTILEYLAYIIPGFPV